MAAPTDSAPKTLPRFSRGERVAHRTLAALMILSILTAAVLYNGSLALLVGHRHSVELVHVYAGFALPVPLLAGLASRAFRADLTRLNRFARSDWRWLRTRSRRDGTIRVGKFNAGQKLNGALTAGSITVLLGTGVLMYFTGLVRLPWRTGATFVHDWFALGLGLLVLGHIYFALLDPEARRGMRTGRVSTRWARAEHAAWVEELLPTPDGPHDTGTSAQSDT
jgi:formate dehydrogenase subunit gamma